MLEKENIREIKQRLEAIIETALDGIITIDERGIIESINQAGAEIFGYSMHELIGQSVNILMTSPHRNLHDDYMHQYSKTGIKKMIGLKREEIGRKKDGSLFPIRLAVTELIFETRRIFTGIIHDLTEEKKSEEAIIRINVELEKKVASQTFELKMAIEKLLETNKQLEDEIKEKTKIEQKLRRSQQELRQAFEVEKELNEMKSRFVSMTSHEFRTPLSTIFSSASIIDRYSLESQQENRSRHTKKIRKSVTMLINVLDEFLNLSRLEKDIVVVQKEAEPYFIKEYCQEIIQDLESLLKKGQEIRLDIKEEDQINLDPSILKQILYNILSNAIKYSMENSEIVISAWINENILSMSVKDEGIGIPDEEQKHLFTRFFRASNVFNIQGTGLGLHLVLYYLNLLNGKVSFESKLEEGTIFTVEIPC